MNRQLQYELFDTIYNAAQAQGALAGAEHAPTPMTVVQHANPMDDSSEVQRYWDVPSGVCGFAWVVVRPRTSSFARWLVKRGLAKRDYYGGVSIWIRQYNQCYEKKLAHASAMANYLQSVGIKAYAHDRLD